MKSYYIKKRSNPQLGVYYVPLGQLTKKDARSRGKAIYGSNEILEFVTEDEYSAFIEKLKAEGQRIQ